MVCGSTRVSSIGAEDDVLERGREDEEDEVVVDLSNMVPASNKRFNPPVSVVDVVWAVLVVVMVGMVDIVVVVVVWLGKASVVENPSAVAAAAELIQGLLSMGDAAATALAMYDSFPRVGISNANVVVLSLP